MENLVIQHLVAKNGEKTLQINDYLIHSKYNPSQEAQKIVDAEYREGYVTVVFGMGLGYIPHELLKRNINENQLIVIDPLLDQLETDLPLKGIFIDSLVEFEELLKSILSNFSIRIQVIAIPNYRKLFPNLFRETLEIIEKVQYLNQVSINTVNHFAELWQENYIKNIGFLNESASLSSLFNQYSCPVIIVSAGPSLKKQIPLLKKIKDEVVLLCSGSTITALLAEDIVPDYIVSIDGGDNNFHHFKNLDVKSSKLLYSFSNRYKIQQELNVEKFAFINYEDKKFGEILKSNLEIDLPQIAGGGSVALFAYFIALKITSGPIAFIGQDLAFTNGQTHSTGHRISSKLEESYFAKRQKILTEGYYGDQVLTDYPFLSMKNELEVLHKLFGDREHIYNCTEGGVKIDGINQIPFSEFIDSFVENNNSKPNIPFEKINVSKEKIIQWLDSEVVKLNQSKKILQEILLELTQVKRKQKFDSQSSGKMDKLETKVLKILNSGLMMRIIHPIIISTMENFTPSKNETEYEAFLRVYHQNKQLYEQLLKAVEKNILFIQQTVEYIKEKQ